MVINIVLFYVNYRTGYTNKKMEKLKKTQPDGMCISLSIGSPMLWDFVMVYTCNFIQWVVF